MLCSEREFRTLREVELKNSEAKLRKQVIFGVKETKTVGNIQHYRDYGDTTQI